MAANGPRKRRRRPSPDQNFRANIESEARFLQARTALDGAREVVLLDFEISQPGAKSITIGLACPLKSVRTLVHTCLKALDSFGDQPAGVLLKVLNRPPSRR